MKNYARFVASISLAALLLSTADVMAETAAGTPAPAAPASPHTLTGNVGLFTQYVFRGLTQTNEDPALQGGFDYSHASGFYAGIWGSNISWFTDAYPGTSTSLELDTYFGYKNAIAGGDVTYDIGFLRYNYPGTFNNLPTSVAKPDTDEIYAAVGYKWFTLKYSYSLGDTFAIKEARGTSYVDLSATFNLPENFILGLHVGRQDYRGGNSAFWGSSGLDNNALDYTDYRISLTKDLNGYLLGLAFSDTNAKASGGIGNVAIYNNAFGKNVGDSQVVLSVARVF